MLDLSMTLPASAAPSALRNIKPPSQNTAPVHEFACLYTHDLRRRKQKRWHDGFLKLHTFNKRAMVYDQSRNHIGDTYWKEGNQLQEGDELTLENGVIVEVAEPKSTTQTDLTPILQKRPRDPVPGAFSSGIRRVPGACSSGIRPSAVSQPLNRPLSAVLGTPKGPLGKAQLPIRSPFEERQSNDWAARERAAKRQRVAEVGQAWNASKDTRTPVPKSRVQPLGEYSDAGRVAMAPPLVERQTPLAQRDRSRAVPQDVIDLTSDVEEPMSSDVTIPNTPPTIGRPPAPQRKNAPDGRPTIEAPKNAPSPRPKTLKLRAGPRKKMLLCQEPAAPQLVPPKPTPRKSSPLSPPVDKDVGPWSTEAVDLFDWRPPGYVFQGQGKGFAPPEVQEGDMLKT